MKRSLLIFSLLVLAISTGFAQAGTPNWNIDATEGGFYFVVARDTALNQNNGTPASDSSLFKFVPPFDCYYRGMVVTAKAAGVSTIRFVQRSASLGTAIDSTVTTTQGIGTNGIFTGVGETSTRAMKVRLSGATEYRLEGIYTSGAVLSRLSVLLVFSSK